MTDHKLKQIIYNIVAELRLLAAAGLKFSSTHHDEERYTRVRQAAAELAALVEDASAEQLTPQLEGDIFDRRVSPLLTVDAAVMRDGKILLIKRHDNGLWAMPGGLVEVNQTLADAALRELEEETGVVGSICKLLGIFDSHLWESRSKLHMQHAVFLVDGDGSEPRCTPEALDVGFFAEADLPPLSPGHDRRVPFVLQLLRQPERIPYYDRVGESPNGRGDAFTTHN